MADENQQHQEKNLPDEESTRSEADASLEFFPFDGPAQPHNLTVTGEPTQSTPANRTDEDLAPGDAEPPALFAALTRMLLGSTLQGSEFVSSQLRDWERNNPPDPEILDAKANENEADRRRYALLGMLLEAADRADQGIQVVSRLSESTARILLAPARLIGNSLPMRPVKKGFDRLAQRGEREWDRYVQKGRAVELRSRRMSQEVVNGSVDEVAGYFSDSEEIQVLIKGQIELLVGNLPSTPEMDELVKALAGNYLQYLEHQPQVLQPLIQSQADEYLDYLEQNPETVQEIISGQSLGLAAGIRDQIRERLISVDYLIEKLLRAILRKPPRWEVEAPPQAVRARAEFGWQPVDSRKLKKVSAADEQ